MDQGRAWNRRTLAVAGVFLAIVLSSSPSTCWRRRRSGPRASTSPRTRCSRCRRARSRCCNRSTSRSPCAFSSPTASPRAIPSMRATPAACASCSAPTKSFPAACSTSRSTVPSRTPPRRTSPSPTGCAACPTRPAATSSISGSSAPTAPTTRTRSAFSPRSGRTSWNTISPAWSTTSPTPRRRSSACCRRCRSTARRRTSTAPGSSTSRWSSSSSSRRCSKTAPRSSPTRSTSCCWRRSTRSSPRRSMPSTKYLMRGGKAVVFADPNLETPTGKRPVMPGMPAPSSHGLQRLFESWGVEISEGVIGDAVAGQPINFPPAGERMLQIQYLPWLGLREANFNAEDVTTAHLQFVTMSTAGHVELAEGSGLAFEPLLRSSGQAMEFGADKVAFRPNPMALIEAFAPSGRDYVLAARVGGTVRSAFPDGPAAAARAAVRGRRRRGQEAGRGRARAGAVRARRAQGGAPRRIAATDQRHPGGGCRHAGQRLLGAGAGVRGPATGDAVRQQRRFRAQRARQSGRFERGDRAAQPRPLGPPLHAGR